MTKYVKQHMENIEGIAIYPIISFLIFFLFFIGLAVYVLKSKESHIRRMKQMPFEDNSRINNHEIPDNHG